MVGMDVVGMDMVSMDVVGMDVVSMGVVCLFEKIYQYCKEFYLRTDLILEHSCQQQQQQQQKQQQYTNNNIQTTLYNVYCTIIHDTTSHMAVPDKCESLPAKS